VASFCPLTPCGIVLYRLAFFLSLIVPCLVTGLLALVQHLFPGLLGRTLTADFYLYCLAATARHHPNQCAVLRPFPVPGIMADFGQQDHPDLVARRRSDRLAYLGMAADG